MDASLRIVTKIPMEEVWRPSGSVICPRVRMLTGSDIQELLRSATIEFVVADVGRPLQWIEAKDRFDFWKNDAKPHLADPDLGTNLESFPDTYCYLASQWDDKKSRATVILLERHH